MAKKKIMHIAQSAGGVERYIQSLFKNINREKFDNILVCSYDYKEENYKDYDIVFEQIDMIREINLISDLKSIIKLRKLIKKYNPDVIYMHSSKAGAVGRISNIGLNNISLYNPHGWSFNMKCNDTKRIIYRNIEKYLSKFTDKIIAISEFEKTSAIENLICDGDKIDVIRNGIDILSCNNKKHKLERKEIGIKDDVYIIGSVGRLTKQKAPDIFVKAAVEIKKSIPNSFFMLVGDGEDRKAIEGLINESGLSDDILITGWVDDPMEYIQIFDQALLLSRWEGFGLVLAEYMHCEKPIIATDVDAIPEVVKDGTTGILVNVDDIDGVAKEVIKLYKNKNQREYIVKNAKKDVETRFNVIRVANQLEKLIDNL